MKRFGRALFAAAYVAAAFGTMAVTLWDDREQMLADLRQMKRAWISPGRSDESG